MKLISTFLLSALGTSIAFAGPVSEHGRLRVDGARIVGVDGRPASLAGNSFFWSQWMGRFYNATTVNWLKQDWHAGIVRVAMGVEGGGYLTNPQAELAKVTTVVDAAIAADLYVIVDWHDHQAQLHTEPAVAFFSDIARRYGTKPNLIYEIFNEPKRGVTWPADVKPYAEKVVAAIRAIDPDNLIVVGTPNWSQDVDIVANDPLKPDNIAYALHFYAGTHKQRLRDKAVKAMHQGLALFVTEWGTCNSDGNGPVDVESIREWMAFMREWQLSHCNWSVADKRETASILVPGAAATGGWTESDLTESGRVAREYIRDWAANPPGRTTP